MEKVLVNGGGFQFLDAQPICISAKDHRPAYGTDGDYFSKPSVEDIFDPLPQTRGSSPSNLIDSPTLLPSDQDRELARRLQGGIGGLGAIA